MGVDSMCSRMEEGLVGAGARATAGVTCHTHACARLTGHRTFCLKTNFRRHEDSGGQLITVKTEVNHEDSNFYNDSIGRSVLNSTQQRVHILIMILSKNYNSFFPTSHEFTKNKHLETC